MWYTKAYFVGFAPMKSKKGRADEGRYFGLIELLHLLLSTNARGTDRWNHRLTHQNPGTVSVQIIAQTMSNESHGLNLVKVRMIKEVGQA